MVVIATPVSQAPPPQPGIGTVERTKYYDKPLLHKRRGLVIPSGANVLLQFQLLTQQCGPVDLTAFGFGFPIVSGTVQSNVVVRIRESVDTANAPMYETQATVNDPTSGSIQVPIPPSIAISPGVYDAEFGVFNNLGTLAMTNRIYIWVDYGLFGQRTGGLPALDEVRMAMQDTDPGANLILNNFENDVADLCYAAVSAVRTWNESQPPIELKYSTNDYPYTQKWINGIVGTVYTTRAKAFLRNHLPYQAAGVSVDDQNKWQQYLQIGQQMLQEYQEWVKQKKVQINAEGAITTLGSPYSTFDLWP